MDNKTIYQAIINTLSDVEIKSTPDNLQRMMAVQQILAELRDKKEDTENVDSE